MSLTPGVDRLPWDRGQSAHGLPHRLHCVPAAQWIEALVPNPHPADNTNPDADANADITPNPNPTLTLIPNPNPKRTGFQIEKR